MAKLVTSQYQDLTVSFTEDGWFNATEVAARFGKSPAQWLRLPSTTAYLQALERKYGKITYLRSKRGSSGGTWLHPKLAVRFAQWLDMDFAVWCDEQIEALIHGQHQHYNWTRLRHESAASFKVMERMLQLKREAEGKATAPHHYMNEAKLVNGVMTGIFKGRDRDKMSLEELDLLARLEETNAVQIGCGIAYPERKEALGNFVAEWRKTHHKQIGGRA